MGMFAAFGLLIMLGLYFTFAAVQGDFGVFKRAELRAEGRALQSELDKLQSQIVEYENLTQRLSDNYLDLDLLDERVREVLGFVRADEIVIQ